MIVALAEVEVHALYSVRTFPGSASQPAYRLPPPTTLAGALAKAWLSYVELEMREVLEDGGRVLSAAARFVKSFYPLYVAASIKVGSIAPPTFGQPIRVFTGIYQSLKTRRELAESMRVQDFFGPYVVGYASYPRMSIILMFATARDFEERALRRVLWSVTRVGSKESLVSVSNVYIYRARPVELAEEAEVNAINPLPIEVAEPLDRGSVILEETIFPITLEEWLNHFSRDAPQRYAPPLRMVAYPVDVARFRLRRKCLGVEIPTELGPILGVSRFRMRSARPLIVIP